jgi:ribosomal protein L29
VASATDRLETPSEIKKAKKDVARLLTIKRQRELEAEKTKQAAAGQQGK